MNLHIIFPCPPKNRTTQHPAAVGGNEFASTIAADARNSADILDKMPAHDSPIISLPTIPSVAEDEPIAVSEYLAEAYLRFADASTNPTY